MWVWVTTGVLEVMVVFLCCRCVLCVAVCPLLSVVYIRTGIQLYWFLSSSTSRRGFESSVPRSPTCRPHASPLLLGASRTPPFLLWTRFFSQVSHGFCRLALFASLCFVSPTCSLPFRSTTPVHRSCSALLGMLEFDGASKRSKPNLKVRLCRA